MNLKELFLYITNNEKISRHEVVFDIIFFMVNTTALIVGIIILISYDEKQWIPFLIIEYTWALDTMRHNRP